MRVVKFLAFSVVACLVANASYAAPITLVGGALRNGNLDDISNATKNGNATGEVDSPADTDGDGTRAAISSSSVGARVSIPFWEARRVSYPGGNSFFGFDNSTGTPLGGVSATNDFAFLFNNGGVDLIHDTLSAGGGSLSAGDVFTLTYDLGSDQADDNITNSVVFEASGSILVADSVVATPPATVSTGVVSLSGADGLTQITHVYTVPSSLATDDINIRFVNVGSGSNGVNRAAIDNVSLSYSAVVPEPGTVPLSMLALTSLGAAGMRRRLG